MRTTSLPSSCDQGGFPGLPPPNKALSCSAFTGGGWGTSAPSPPHKLPSDVSNGEKSRLGLLLGAAGCSREWVMLCPLPALPSPSWRAARAPGFADSNETKSGLIPPIHLAKSSSLCTPNPGGGSCARGCLLSCTRTPGPASLAMGLCKDTMSLSPPSWVAGRLRWDVPYVPVSPPDPLS